MERKNKVRKKEKSIKKLSDFDIFQRNSVNIVKKMIIGVAKEIFVW